MSRRFSLYLILCLLLILRGGSEPSLDKLSHRLRNILCPVQVVYVIQEILFSLTT